MPFLREFAHDPRTVGAVAPSGPALARAATAVVPGTGSPVVVELGPGTGAFTGPIQRRLAGRGRHIAVEVNVRFARRLAVSLPGVEVVHADASDLAEVLARRGLGRADVVVSGLPWAAFTGDRRHAVLSAVVASLPPHGVFTTFAYVHARWMPPARRLHAELRSRFDEVVVGRTVWANLPPALVYYCRRPVAEPGRPVRALAGAERGGDGPLTGRGSAWDHAPWIPK
ncbi:phospholipid N-methyltransferase [Actinocorallia herbida]|uniref:Phospholipid N-methyltransferase n=1 Tax=Actinocorallia herbida TaxID=58109 RepID=A0A3N1D141_9ACTN|nr:SAM-dependent methyltransferase [Actinocorallia herbida]ROO87247.1 phospholipid N-methyltransferase [Actinocorallia herbida]